MKDTRVLHVERVGNENRADWTFTTYKLALGPSTLCSFRRSPVFRRIIMQHTPQKVISFLWSNNHTKQNTPRTNLLSVVHAQCHSRQSNNQGPSYCMMQKPINIKATPFLHCCILQTFSRAPRKSNFSDYTSGSATCVKDATHCTHCCPQCSMGNCHGADTTKKK